MGDDLEPYLTTETIGFIRHKARYLAGKYGFHRDEAEDIEQDLILDFIGRFRRFNQRRGSEQSFAKSIVNHGVATLIEAQKVLRRGYGVRPCSLSSLVYQAVPNSPSVEEITSDPAQLLARTLNLKVDVAKVIAVLPAQLGQICLLLMVLNPAQVAVLVGLSRATLYRRVQLIREVFYRARLGDYIYPIDPSTNWNGGLGIARGAGAEHEIRR